MATLLYAAFWGAVLHGGAEAKDGETDMTVSGQHREGCSGPVMESRENAGDLAIENFSVPSHLPLLPVRYASRLLLRCSIQAILL